MIRSKLAGNLVALLALPLLGACVTAAEAPPATTEAPSSDIYGAVSAADPRAEEAGKEMLRRGGSATDAAIAVMLALNVVEPQSSGIGGGGFYVRATPDGLVETLDGRETAPAGASPAWFLDDQNRPVSFSKAVRSGLSVGVPGNMALAAMAHARYGKLPWATLFGPAIRLARDGFVMNKRLHGSVREAADRAGLTAEGRALFFDSNGDPLPPGSRIANPALAETLKRLAQEGPKAFYQADNAEALAHSVAASTPHAEAMTSTDISSYRAQERLPVCASYRAYRICGMGPPTSGGIAVLQILKQLERFDLAALGPQSPRFWHLFLESQRLAYADRELYLGDPDFVDVPVSGLLAEEYLAIRSGLIDPDSALAVVPAGTPAGFNQPRADGDEPPESGTSHFAVADAQGNLVSYTSTIEGAFGSGLMFGGFYLNNELTDFSFVPQVGGRPVANRVEGGKRPRSSMAPMVVYGPDSRLLMAVGAAGGATIPVQTARAIIGVIDFDLPLNEALGLPLVMEMRGRILVESETTLDAMIPELQALGHQQITPYPLGLKAGGVLREVSGWSSARDPRLDGKLDYLP